MLAGGEDMAKAVQELTLEQIESAVDRLDTKSKVKLLEKISSETRKARWEPLFKRLEDRYRKNPISEEEIVRICKDVRKERYAKKTKGRS